MQNPSTGVRWMVAAIASISIATAGYLIMLIGNH